MVAVNFAMNSWGEETYLGLARAAIRHSKTYGEDVIAALGDALVLVASGVEGGSKYALRAALRRRTPVWCFECGARTPPANAGLLRAGHARPLSLGGKADAWAEEIIRALPAAGRPAGPHASSRSQPGLFDRPV